MKKVLIVAATAGLMSLAAACSPAANNSAADTNVVEANAQTYDDVANVGTDANVTVETSNTTVETTNTTVTNTH